MLVLSSSLSIQVQSGSLTNTLEKKTLEHFSLLQIVFRLCIGPILDIGSMDVFF